MNISVTHSLGSSLNVDELGARKILTLRNEPILVQVTRGDGKTASTHPCTPVFAQDRNQLYGLNQHGNMRSERVNLDKLDDHTLKVSHTITDPGYPKGMKLIQRLKLDEQGFELEVTHTNEGDQAAAVNFGEHCYFDAPSGFAGTRLNGQDITEIIREHKDGLPLPLNKTNQIEIPGKPPIELNQEGFNFAMVWVGTDPSLTNKDGNYVCIEPVEGNPHSDFFGAPASMIKPGESRVARFSLGLK